MCLIKISPLILHRWSRFTPSLLGGHINHRAMHKLPVQICQIYKICWLWALQTAKINRSSTSSCRNPFHFLNTWTWRYSHPQQLPWKILVMTPTWILATAHFSRIRPQAWFGWMSKIGVGFIWGHCITLCAYFALIYTHRLNGETGFSESNGNILAAAQCLVTVMIKPLHFLFCKFLIETSALPKFAIILQTHVLDASRRIFFLFKT